jgi:hypothetical protein
MSEELVEIEGVPAQVQGAGGGASAESLAALEAYAGQKLPESYLRLLQWKDGFQALLSTDFDSDRGGYLILYSAGEVAERNRAYDIKEYERDRLLVGTNGGGEAYLIEHGGPRWFEVPWLDLGDPRYTNEFPDLKALLEDLASRD